MSSVHAHCLTNLRQCQNGITKERKKNMDSGQFIDTFPVQTDSLPKFKSYISSLLRREKYEVEHTESSEDSFLIVAAKGNKLLHYIAEQILEYVPFSELLGWAVRVQISFAVVGKNDHGHYLLRVKSEPACNEINPVAAYMEQGEERDFMQAAGEDKKCQEAFRHFTQSLLKSKYLVQK